MTNSQFRKDSASVVSDIILCYAVCRLLLNILGNVLLIGLVINVTRSTDGAKVQFIQLG